MASEKAWKTPSAPLPLPQVPMPTAMRGRLGSSLARPASLTALNEEMSCMRISLPFLVAQALACVLPLPAFALQSFHLAVQGLFVHVAVDGVIHFHHRRQGALSETGDRAQRELAIGRGDADFIGAAFVAAIRNAQFQLQALQQAARPARVAGGPAADADSVVALRLEIEQGKECGHAINLRQRNIGLFGDIFEDFQRQVFVRMMFLNFFQDAEQRAGAVLAGGDRLIREFLVAQGRLRLGQVGFHFSGPPFVQCVTYDFSTFRSLIDGLHFELSNMPGESTNPWGQSWAGITLGQYGARSAARGSRAESGLLDVADPERAETYRVSILNGSNGAKILARALLNAASNTAWSPYLQFGCLEFQAFNRSPGRPGT